VKLVLLELPLGSSPDAANWRRVRGVLERGSPDLSPHDVVVLPELLDRRPDRGAYEEAVAGLGRLLGCHVVGGSQYEQCGDRGLNSGVAVDASGRVVCRYEKLRPYGSRRDGAASAGKPAELVIAGRRVVILLCADFWFSAHFQRVQALPDLVLVPACSVTRKPSARFARALWRHMAIGRAYEFGAFVGISDWSRSSRIERAPGAVAGFADPTATEPGSFFTPVGRGGLKTYQLDYAALDAFRVDRLDRGFFWRDLDEAAGGRVDAQNTVSRRCTIRTSCTSCPATNMAVRQGWTAFK
jgi:omega-amidase